MNRFLYALASVVFLVSTPAAAALSPAEQVMIRSVDAEQPRTTAMLERWVDQNSGTMNLAGVQAVRAMVEPEFQQLGFTCMKPAARGIWLRGTPAAGAASGYC